MSALAEIIRSVAAAVVAARDELNRLDGVAGDGDLGITMGAAAEAATEAVNRSEGDAPDVLLRRLGLAIAAKAPSTGGTLLASALLGAARVAPEEDESVVAGIARRVRAAQLAIEARGGAKVGDKSMLDALVPAVEALDRDARAEEPLHEALAHAAAAAQDGAWATKGLTPRVGRAGWLVERSIGSEDAGAHLVALVFAAAAHSATPRAPDRERS